MIGSVHARSANVACGMWAGLGLALAVFTGLYAWLRSVRPAHNVYAGDVYGMTSGTHRRYAGVSLAFAAIFAAALLQPALPAVPLLAVYALVAVFYFSSFARGFSDE